MFRKEAFRRWATSRLSPNSVTSYISSLNHVDRVYGGLDAKLKELGPSGFKKWYKTENFSSDRKTLTNTRAHLRKYREFHIETQQSGEPESDFHDEIGVEATTEPQLFPPGKEPRIFQLEQDLQAAVRAQLDKLEPGLVEDDGGREISVATGRIDIVARDKDGKPVAIELKAGPCPTGALEQVLGYAADLEDERGEEVRAYLIAGSFSDRTRAAARRMTGLELRTYEFSLRFNALTD